MFYYQLIGQTKKAVECMSDYPLLYTRSSDYAKSCNQLDLWRESHKSNIECAKAIESAIKRDFNNNRLDRDCAKSVIDQFGFDRVNFILRYTLKNSQHDHRYSDENRKWGADLYLYDDKYRSEYFVNSHPAILNGFIDEAKDEWKKLGLWDSSHCIDKTGIDLEDKVLVLDPSKLKDQYKTPDFQLFIAKDGFGCSPTAIGRSVYGYFAKDDEYTSWQRSDFIGILKDEFIPDWVKDKYDISTESTEPVEDGGMTMS